MTKRGPLFYLVLAMVVSLLTLLWIMTLITYVEDHPSYNHWAFWAVAIHVVILFVSALAASSEQ